MEATRKKDCAEQMRTEIPPRFASATCELGRQILQSREKRANRQKKEIAQAKIVSMTLASQTDLRGEEQKRAFISETRSTP